MPDQTKISVSKSKIARLMFDGIEDMGWDVITHYHDGSMAKASEKVIEYLKRKGIEVRK